MYKIIFKSVLSSGVKLFKVDAPLIAKKAQPGQFIILRIDENGERIPLTIAEFDRTAGTVTLIFQEVGASTIELGRLKCGDALTDIVGPLGKATHIEIDKTVVCIGGGIGIAPIFPIARGMKEAGNEVVSIIGARSSDILFWEEEMQAVSHTLYVTTDDGTHGRKGLVTHVLQELIEAGKKIDEVIAIGPVIMMKFVAELTRKYNIPTVVSLNPVMIDGTGMCGGCRVQVGNENKFACVDGPEFDAHKIDFDGLMARQRFFKAQEKKALDLCQNAGGDHKCQCR